MSGIYMGPSARFTIRSTLMIVLTLFCISCIISITYLSYSETRNSLILSNEREQNASENLFIKSSIYIHQGMRLWDSAFDQQMQEDMGVFLAAYNASGGHPAQLNLTDVICQMDPLYRNRIDLFLINRSGIIAYTTDTTQYLMDMSIWPNFYPRFLEILDGSSFIPDEVVRGFNPSSPMRKYVYQPTSDHNYVAQIGLNVQNESVRERANLSYGSLVSYVKEQNPELEDLHVIGSMGSVVIGKKAYRNGKLDSVSRNITNHVFASHERVIIPDPQNLTMTSYVYVPNSVDNTPSSPYMNLVGKFIFSTANLNRQLTYNLMVHLFLAISASFFALLIAHLVTRRITSPLNQLVTEIDLISDGAFDQEISETRHPELGKIASSVRSMVRQITGVIKELQVSESRYRGLFNTSTDAILILDGEEIIDSNPAAIALFSFEENLVGMKISSLCQPIWEYMQCPSYVYQESEKCSRSPNCLSESANICETDIRIGPPEGAGRYLNIRVVPLTKGIPSLTQVQIRDITRRVEMEKELHNLNNDLEQQVEERTAILKATIADLDSFSYTVSHDLRGPLRAIDGNAHLLRVKCGDHIQPDLARHLVKIIDNVRLMDNLIDDLLRFARMSRKPFETEYIDMNQLVSGVAEEIFGPVPSSVFRFDCGDLPRTKGDVTLIRQVLVNLLSNALKFGKSGICNHISVFSDDVKGMTWFHIRDTGIGLDMEYSSRIFDVFVQLHPAETYEGTGVGLAIVKRIVIRHGGQIRVQSEEGVGSVFSFTLEGVE